MEENILIIEDDKFLRELISRKLINEKFKIDQAIDGEEGLKKLQEVKPDLVLLDLILPGLDGFEVLERMKDNPSTSAIPVLILSNLGQKDEIEKGLKLGAVDFLVKAHFTPEEIVSKIKIVLGDKTASTGQEATI
jgi:DNA-binding response OmpR family regulator